LVDTVLEAARHLLRQGADIIHIGHLHAEACVSINLRPGCVYLVIT